MAFNLPSANSKIRALFDLESLASFGTGEKVVTMSEARQAARRLMFDSVGDVINPEICGVNFIVNRADGQVVLMSFTRNKAPKTIWNFSKA